MAEVTFAKQFLAQLDARPTKRSSDWVADARRLPAHPPFTLPKPDVAYPAPAASTPASSTPASTSAAAASSLPSGQAAATGGIAVTLKPLRGTPTVLPPVPAATTSIYDIKALCAKQTGYAPDKIKVLWERKPVADAKTLADVLGPDAAEKTAVELGVMFVGQPNAAPKAADAAVAIAAEAPARDEAPIAQGESGAAVMESPQFWRDLEGFVLQRVRDEAIGKEAVELWKKAWTTRAT